MWLTKNADVFATYRLTQKLDTPKGTEEEHVDEEDIENMLEALVERFVFL